jgi:hypothetical protein
MMFARFWSASYGVKGEQGVTASAAFVRNPSEAMPRLYPTPLNGNEVVALATSVQQVLQAAPGRAGPPWGSSGIGDDARLLRFRHDEY